MNGMCRYVVLMVVELVGSGAEPAVKPKIPLAGRPETFIGAIGTFTARADAHPKTIQLGDTVEYRVDVLGKGDVSAVTVPHLYRQRGFAEDFEPVGRPRFESLPDGKRIVYRLRPKTMLSRRIPSLWLTYYDPTLRRFQTIRTEPIALLVQPPTRPRSGPGPRSTVAGRRLGATAGQPAIDGNDLVGSARGGCVRRSADPGRSSATNGPSRGISSR